MVQKFKVQLPERFKRSMVQKFNCMSILNETFLLLLNILAIELQDKHRNKLLYIDAYEIER